MSMVKIKSLISNLNKAYPHIIFNESIVDKWSPETQTVNYNPSQSHAEVYLLHELAHALLGHESYKKDIELLQIERDAWSYAKKTLAPQFQTTISDELIDTSLDTYRDWIHTKSTCPRCEASGLEIAPRQYFCICCSHRWRVNEGIASHVKRYSQII
jgi:hypothetical protein